MLRGKHMGFKNVRRVEVKAETTTPGEVRTTTDANGTRVSTSRGRRTLPKLEFTVDEDGAILHGPQRGAFPYSGMFSTPNSSSMTSGGTHVITSNTQPNQFHETNAMMDRDLLYQSASFQALHMRDFPSPPSHSHHLDQFDEHEDDENEHHDALPKRHSAGSGNLPVPPMKECVLNDTRATTMAIKYDNSVDRFVCGSSIERFSGHTGVCRVLGSKKYPIVPHSLQIGDLLRIGSVGLVVCELNRTTRDETQEALSEDEYDFLKEHYLSLPLQQTFHPTESQRQNNQDEEDEDEDEDDVVGGRDPSNHSNKHHRRGFRAGETSDEGESEEDRKAVEGDPSNNDSVDDDEHAPIHERSIGASGMVGKKFCYICYDGDEEPEENPLVAPCHCKGDTKYVHLNCLQRWNNNLDADGTNPNQKVCAVTNTDGLDVCTICKATYLTSVKLDDGRVVSLLAQKLPPPYVTFAVVTQHETRNRQTALTNTRFQLSFANLPRNQQSLTIGRSTNNNMTLRYRTVSQLHAKITYKDDNFLLTDASSSNGTMLFLSRPLQLEWNKVVHVKIGRTILTLKSKKKWKWSGGNNESAGTETEYGATAASPSAIGGLALTPTNMDAITPVSARSSNPMSSRAAPHRSVPNRFEANGPTVLSDPSAEIVSSPYSLHELFGRSHTATPGSVGGFHAVNRAPIPHADHGNQVEATRLSDLLEEEAFRVNGHTWDGSRREAQPVPAHRQPYVRVASFSHSSRLNSRGAAALPRTRSELIQRRDHLAYDVADSLAGLDLASPRVDVDSHRSRLGSPIVASSSSTSSAFGNREP